MRITWHSSETRDGITTTRSEEVTEEFYHNFVDSIPFFNRWGKEGKGYCQGRKSSTPYGKMITDITTVDPWGTTTIKTHFEIATN